MSVPFYFSMTISVTICRLIYSVKTPCRYHCLHKKRWILISHIFFKANMIFRQKTFFKYKSLISEIKLIISIFNNTVFFKMIAKISVREFFIINSIVIVHKTSTCNADIIFLSSHIKRFQYFLIRIPVIRIHENNIFSGCFFYSQISGTRNPLIILFYNSDSGISVTI